MNTRSPAPGIRACPRVPDLNRRDFIRRTAAMAGGVLAAGSPLAANPPGTAADQVTLGRTGLKCSRLGLGTGTRSGNVQRALGHDGFNRLVQHAYERGITCIDTAQSYRTHDWIREAVKGLPREKLFIQTKIGGGEKPLETIDGFRKELDMDYVDSLLVHCSTTKNWGDERARTIDAVREAQSRGWARASGVSCHSLPALQLATTLDWVNVHLVRLNPQGAHLDTPAETSNARSNPEHVPPVVAEVKRMRARGHGVIGMKVLGEGDFTDPAEREKSIRWVMQSGLADAVVIGFKSTAEIDEAIERINRALAEG